MLARDVGNLLLVADTLMARAREVAALGRREEAIAAFERVSAYCWEKARYLMGDDYRRWALLQLGGEARAQKELLG